MKKLLIGLLLALGSFAVSAQHPRPDFEKIQVAKMGMISNRINLSEKQAEKFWPVYNEYSEQRKEMSRDFRRKLMEARQEGRTEEQKSRLMDERLQLKEKELQLERAFKDRFLKVISVEQYMNMLEAEKDFHRLLIEKAGKRN